MNTKTKKKIPLDYNVDTFNKNFYMYFADKFIKSEVIEQELNFIIKRLGVKPNHKILDLPCGHGLYSIPLAKKGYSLVGIDLNLDFIVKASQTAKKEKLTINFVQEDMRQINFFEEFDHVLTLNTSWGYFEHEDNVKVIEKVSRALVPNGFFFLELFNPCLYEQFPKGIKNCTALESEGNLLIDWRSYDYIKNRYVIKRIYIKDGVRKNACLEIQNYSLEQMRLILSEFNLKIVDIYGGQKGRLYDPASSNRMVIIAQKKI